MNEDVLSGDDESKNCSLWILEKPVSLRAVVATMCVLSSLGSTIIVMTYFLNKKLQTRARYILVHLSFSNIGQVVANFIGVSANFDRCFAKSGSFTYSFHDWSTHERSMEEYACISQGFVTVYFSICGMLWTICLAVHLYLLILSKRQSHFTRYFVWLGYIVCYGLPALVSLWLLFTGRLGYAPYSMPGYCGLVSRKPFQDGPNPSNCDPVTDIYGELLGYDLWVFLTIGLTLLFYLSALCYLKLQRNQETEAETSQYYWTAIYNIDYKFIAIPVAFTLLRVWSLVLHLLLTYFKMSPIDHRTTLTLLYMTGLGNSAQGFVDAVIFIVLTHSIRRDIYSTFCLRSKKRVKHSLLHSDRKNVYDESLVNYSPRFVSSSPIHVESTRINDSLETTTSYKESPSS